MEEINSLDLKASVANSMKEVFNTMLPMEAELIDSETVEIDNGNRIVGSVSFAGSVMGNVNIQVSDVFARIMASMILGMEGEDSIGDEEIYDVIGELSNMVGGNLKSRLFDYGFPCNLSIPSITSGGHYRIESKNWARHERVAFRHREHILLVEVYITSNS
jgi:chemotaxis protein CheX